MIDLHGLHETLEGSQGPSDVQQLDATVVQQLVALVSQQRTHGDACKLLGWNGHEVTRNSQSAGEPEESPLNRKNAELLPLNSLM